MTTTRDIAEPGPLMKGKRGLVMGVANDRSIAWGIARVLHGHGDLHGHPTRHGPPPGARRQGHRVHVF